MAAKTEQRRAELKTRLLDIAQDHIARQGARTLRARDLARTAGCSVGAIYNVFDDMNGLIMAVNGRTFLDIGAQVAAVVDADLTPEDQLTQLSLAYLAYARANTGLWRALFDLQTRAEDDVPEWYTDALRELFAHINTPVAQLFPEMAAHEVALMTRTLFSAVHGIVSLGLQNRISAVPADQIETMISRLFAAFRKKM